MSTSWDPDIAALELNDVEKNGLQVFRNYSQAFERYRQKSLTIGLNAEVFEVKDLQAVLEEIQSEEARLLPIVACAYADEVLDKMFRRYVPTSGPGGKDGLFGPYGPLSSFASRIKIAHCFRLLSSDILVELDRLRVIRNRIAHGWDTKQIQEYFNQKPATDMLEIEKVIDGSEHLPNGFYDHLALLDRFRIRLIWLLSRLCYEAKFFSVVAAKGFAAPEFLYGDNAPQALSQVSQVALTSTRAIVQRLKPG